MHSHTITACIMTALTYLTFSLLTFTSAFPTLDTDSISPITDSPSTSPDSSTADTPTLAFESCGPSGVYNCTGFDSHNTAIVSHSPLSSPTYHTHNLTTDNALCRIPVTALATGES